MAGKVVTIDAEGEALLAAEPGGSTETGQLPARGTIWAELSPEEEVAGAKAVFRLVAAERFPLTMPADPLARHMVDFLMPADVREALSAGAAADLGARMAYASTRIIDKHLQTWAEHGHVRQIVLLGAGLDDRAWRLQLVRPGAVFFELDTPMLLSVKAQALRDAFPAQHKRVPVAADLRRPLDAISALATAGWDRSEPTAWVLEGVIQWLPHDHLPLLLHTLFHHSAPLSKLVATLERCDAARLQQMWHAMQLPPVAPPEPVALTAETLMARVADAGFNAVLVMARELGLEYDIDLEEALCCVLGNKPSEAANLAPAAPGPPT